MATLYDAVELEEATDGFSAAWLLGGDVYAAVLEGVPVAVKRLGARASATPGDELLDSLAAAARVASPNLVPLRGVALPDSQGRRACLVIPLRRGGSLEDRLALRGGDPPLTALQRVSVALGAARGLAALHSAGVAHGTLASSRVLLDDAPLSLAAAAQLSCAGLPHGLCIPEDTSSDGYLDPEYSASRQFHTRLRRLFLRRLSARAPLLTPRIRTPRWWSRRRVSLTRPIRFTSSRFCRQNTRRGLAGPGG